MAVARLHKPRPKIEYLRAKHKSITVLHARLKTSGVKVGSVTCAGDGYICNFNVNPAYRGYGIGRELLQKLLSFSDIPKRVWLHAYARESTKYQPGLENFYKSLGFVQKGKEPQGTVMVLDRSSLTQAIVAAYFSDNRVGE